MFTFMLRPTFDEIHKVLQCDMIVQSFYSHTQIKGKKFDHHK